MSAVLPCTDDCFQLEANLPPLTEFQWPMQVTWVGLKEEAKST